MLTVNFSQGSPSKRPTQPPLQLRKVQQSTPARKPGDTQAPVRKVLNSTRRKRIITSSSDEEDGVVHGAALSSSDSPLDSIPDNLRRVDVRVGNDGVIQ